MDGFKIDTVIHGEMVEVDPPDSDGDARLIVTEVNGADDIRHAEVYLNREQRRQLAHALLKMDEQ